MEDFAIIRIRKNQYKVMKGDEILVPGTCDVKEPYEVLLKVVKGNVTIGKPIVKNASIKLKLLSEKFKGEKIEVLKYKAKSRYRKRKGFRSISTKLLVEEIN